MTYILNSVLSVDETCIIINNINSKFITKYSIGIGYIYHGSCELNIDKILLLIMMLNKFKIKEEKWIINPNNTCLKLLRTIIDKENYKNNV